MKLRSLHIFCGSGGDARGFLDAGFTPTGIDYDPRAIDDFQRLTGCEGHVLDLETATVEQLRARVGQRPHVLVLSAPCKWASGLMSEDKALSEKYRRLAALTVRGIDLALSAWPEGPMLVLFENVPRIVSRAKKLAEAPDEVNVLDCVISLLQRSGYATDQRFHDCGEIGGLAQHRKRFLLVARDMERCPDFLREPPKQRVRSIGEEIFSLPVPRPDSPDPMHRLNEVAPVNHVRLAAVLPSCDWKTIPAQIEVVVCSSSEAVRIGLECVQPAAAGVPADVRTKARANKQNGGHGVEAHDRPSHGVVGCSDPSNARASVEDIRLGCEPQAGAYGVHSPDRPSATVLGYHKHGSVADIRLGHAPHNDSYGVVSPDAPSFAVRGCNEVRQATAAVADVRVQWDHSERSGRPDCYGVADPAAPSPTICARAVIQSARASVADTRLAAGAGDEGPIRYDERGWPIPTHSLIRYPDGRVVLYGPELDLKTKKGCHLVIASVDVASGRRAWHRPLTTRELACLQSFPRDFQFCGPVSSSKRGTGQRERIGNAIPCATAKAIAQEARLTILAALEGGFHLSSGPIWVEPEERARA